jgi:hypothetical protein
VRQRYEPANEPRVGETRDDLLVFADEDPGAHAKVVESRERWLWERRQITAHHTGLTEVAAALYPESVRAGDLAVIARPEWILPAPVDLAAIEVSLDTVVRAPDLDGTENITSHLRPLWTPEKRYQRYSHAIRDIARPRLFENRPAWRLRRRVR